MLLSFVYNAPRYQSILARSLPGDMRTRIPDVSTIEKLIEAAWKDGFDVAGAKQLANKVSNTRKWIGTTEIATVLLWLGIKATIYDFHRPSGPGKTHPLLINFVEEYFGIGDAKSGEGRHGVGGVPVSKMVVANGAGGGEGGKGGTGGGGGGVEEAVLVTDRPPLYFQHQGHSRTIVGLERLRCGKRNLIVLDPGRRINHQLLPLCKPPSSSSSSSSSSSRNFSYSDAQGLLKPYRVGEEELVKHAQYQVLCVEGVCEEGWEWEGGKVIWSVKVPEK
ncbi:hypothetical protein HDV00_002661 [Rhizophlyctis rosea]|nr:hypothetical protein HDV00_002661 [Rhizophlyctis rosea]